MNMLWQRASTRIWLWFWAHNYVFFDTPCNNKCSNGKEWAAFGHLVIWPVNEYLAFTYLFDKKHLLLSKFRVPNIITVGNTRVVRSADFREESRLPTGEWTRCQNRIENIYANMVLRISLKLNLVFTFCQNKIENIFAPTCWWSWRWFWRCRESRSPPHRTWYIIILTMIMTILIIILILVLVEKAHDLFPLRWRLPGCFRMMLTIIIIYIIDIIIIPCYRGWSDITDQMRNSICGDTILLRFPCKPASYIFDPKEVSSHAMNPQKWPVFIDFW